LNSSTKSIFPLFESVCVQHGVVLNVEYPLRRFEEAHQKFYGKKPVFGLFEDIRIPVNHKKGRFKLRISYNQNGKEYVLRPYEEQRINRLKLVHDNSVDYDLKFEDRSELNALFNKRMECDDILIVKNGWLTDSSYANIILWDGKSWYTPKTCLLKGTKRMELLEHKKIQKASIPVSDLNVFKGFQLINAMLNFQPDVFLPIKNIMP
jgi:4-amino-4-deoxychorismate lyase